MKKTAMKLFAALLLLCVILPGAISLAVSELLRKIGWIKDGDMKLEG